ncbi:MucR family transcriptional regulator [Geodermatophilus maliterrae]|uniref:MucR family transcriptional regulator n=1 Tax=Geodermatophilus maliterrae TaxID=3162531 RepID=A0ABV3XNH4_9ACTN
MLHPVGPLPAAVYWRRRLLVLALLLALLGGGGWLGVALLTGSDDEAAAAEATAASTPAGAPALDRVVPSLASVQTPTPPPTSAPAPAPAAPAPPEQEAGAVCRDDVLTLEVRTPGTVPAGSRPTLELVVTNTATVPCTRVLDKGLQEMVLLDAAGNRLWGSNDCFPEASSDTRTLAPGEQVAFPLVWGGLTSEPTCTAERVPVAPGQYVLRARLDTKTSPDAPLQIT